MRGLIIFVLLVGVALGWLVRSAHIQRDAVAAIKRAGGRVLYEPVWPFARGLRAQGVDPGMAHRLARRRLSCRREGRDVKRILASR